MARRSSGCLPVIGLILAPCVGGYAVGLPSLALAAPALVPYLYLNDPAEYTAHRTAWLSALAAAPALAFLLIRWASPADGRLRERRTGPGPAGPKGRSGLRSRRPHPVRGYLDRVVLLEAAVSATTLWLLLHGNDAHGPDAMRETFTLIGGIAGAAALVLVGVRLWDRPYTAPPTVQTVRDQARKADSALRRVRADNERMQRLVAEVEAKLARANTRRDFATLRTAHTESYGCANSVHAHYRSVQDSLQVMAWTLRGVRVHTWQPAGVLARAVNRNARAEAAELRTAAGRLADTTGHLRAESVRNLELVQQLNARTADIKHTIRDECGQPGLRWFADLEARRDAARAAEGKPPLHAA